MSNPNISGERLSGIGVQHLHAAKSVHGLDEANVVFVLNERLENLGLSGRERGRGQAEHGYVDHTHFAEEREDLAQNGLARSARLAAQSVGEPFDGHIVQVNGVWLLPLFGWQVAVREKRLPVVSNWIGDLGFGRAHFQHVQVCG